MEIGHGQHGSGGPLALDLRPGKPRRRTALSVAVSLETRTTVDYSRHMVEVFTTAYFDQWLRKLKDRQGRLRILARLDRLAHGNPGDVKTVGHGVLELRLTSGPGYRVYYTQRGNQIVLLLCGGDKSTQQTDITKAHQLAAHWHSKEDGDDG